MRVVVHLAKWTGRRQGPPAAARSSPAGASSDLLAGLSTGYDMDIETAKSRPILHKCGTVLHIGSPYHSKLSSSFIIRKAVKFFVVCQENHFFVLVYVLDLLVNPCHLMFLCKEGNTHLAHTSHGYSETPTFKTPTTVSPVAQFVGDVILRRVSTSSSTGLFVSHRCLLP